MKKMVRPALACLIMLVLFMISSCVEKVPLPEDQQAYAGKWVAADGTYVQLFLDGTGNLETASAQISGGAAFISEGILTITLLGIKKEYSVDSPPSQNDDGSWSMELNSIQYVKE
jgi:hypothetical protein